MEEESSSAIILPPDLAAPRYAIRGFGGTHVGVRHEHNEDRYVVQRTASGGALLVVCDGMGGMGRGDQASAFAVARLVDVLGRGHAHPLDAATTAIRGVDKELVAALGDDGSGRRPGTTCAIVQVERGVAYVTWVGDSAVLLIRDGRLAAESRPHRVVQDLVDQGAMSAEEARTSPLARFLSRSLGGRSPDEPAVEPSMLRPWRLLAGDAVVVCSDGLTETLRAEEIAAIVARGGTEEQTVQALLEEALARQADDNVTVVVARCVDAAGAEGELLAPAWEYVPELASEDEEPDYDSDIRARDPSDGPAPPAGVHPLAVAALVFGVGAAALAVVAIVGWLLLA